MTSIDRTRLHDQLTQEEQRFVNTHPRSRELFERAKNSLLAGVPMNWMVRWAGPFPVFVKGGQGAHFTDVDGHDYIDLCLGDTGAMTGHAPAAAVEAITAQIRHGVTFMLPSEDAVWVSEAHAPLRPALLASGVDGDRCQSLFTAPRARDHAAVEDIDL